MFILKISVEMNRPLVKLVAWLNLVPYLMSGVGVIAGPTVICYGENGHVLLENTLSKCCEESLETHSHNTKGELFVNSDHLPSNDSCGNCLDIPVISNATIPRFRSLLKSPLPVAALPSIGISLLNKEDSYEHFFVELDHPFNTSLSALRTVVLLT